jgi:thiamine transport system substrate-binding protein
MWFFLFIDRIVKIEALSKQWLAIAPSWDASYKMFLAGEAPMVWSYLTSLAYHASQGDFEKYGYVEFREGLPIQVEGMAVIRKAGNPFEQRPCIQPWLDFVLSNEGQKLLSETQFMLPALQDAPIAKFLAQVPTPKKAAVLKLGLDVVDPLISNFGKRVQ